MAKAPPKRSARNAPPPAPGRKRKAARAARPKAKIPSLGSGMMGLGGTGAQGMMP